MSNAIESARNALEHETLFNSQSQKETAPDEEERSSVPNQQLFTTRSFQDLPPEILVEIALLAQTTDPHAHITISNVDTSRRALVQSTPLLWARIDYLYPLRLVYLYLERSVDVPLSVTILPPLYNDSTYHAVLQDFRDEEKNGIKQFMRALRPHRHRIISLRMRCDDLAFDIPGENEGPLPAYEFLWDGSMVKLELLDVELGLWWSEGMKEVAPNRNIKEFHLHGSWTSSHMPLFSANVKSLVIANYRAPFSRIFGALEAAPSLISLTLRDVSFTGIDSKKGFKLHLDHLRSLSLVRIFTSAAEALFGCVVAPNLVAVTLHLVHTLHLVDDPTDINKIQLFPVPQQSVRRLDLTAFETEPLVLHSVFTTFPCITHLRIASSNLSRNHLYPLLGRQPDFWGTGRIETACPDLRHLTIENEFNEITGRVLELASFRHGSGTPLESVTLQGIPFDDDVRNDTAGCRKLVQTNTRVEFPLSMTRNS